LAMRPNQGWEGFLIKIVQIRIEMMVHLLNLLRID
jgi:hypothetical protein